jgi:predicted transcriptional regulator
MKSLTKSEEQLMQVLWKLGQGFLKDIVENCPEPRPHSNTVATILKILIEKGYVTNELQGRNNIYRPAISKAEYSKRSVNQLVKSYFDGSPAKLVSHFLSDSKLSLGELEELLKQVRSLKKPD